MTTQPKTKASSTNKGSALSDTREVTMQPFGHQSVREAVLAAEFRVERAHGRGTATMSDLDDLLDTIEHLAREMATRNPASGLAA